MDLIIKTLIGILIPLFGTSLGSAAVFFLKNNIGENANKAFLGFASGVMTAASVWSLIIPSVECARENGAITWIPPLVGVLSGFGFLILLDLIIPQTDDTAKTSKLILAVTIHNFPEGMAVGVVFAGLLSGTVGITFASALALSVGIAVQNLPEGAIISLPLVSDGGTKGKSFLVGVMSGVVEPVGAILMLLLTSVLTPVLPYVLSFAAGAMLYVVVEELIPEAQSGKRSYICSVSYALGFSLMMLLDIALG